MSKALHIAVQYIATMCASMHIAPINMLEGPLYHTYVVYLIYCPVVSAMYDNWHYDDGCLQYPQNVC